MDIIDCIILVDHGSHVYLYDFDIGERSTRRESVATITDQLAKLGYKPVWHAKGEVLLTRQVEEVTSAEIDRILLEHLP